MLDSVWSHSRGRVRSREGGSGSSLEVIEHHVVARSIIPLVLQVLARRHRSDVRADTVTLHQVVASVSPIVS
jgi:hypothetical protein